MTEFGWLTTREKKKRKKMAVIMVLGGNGQWNCQKFLSWAWNAGILGIGRGKWVISCVFRCLLVVLVVVTWQKLLQTLRCTLWSGGYLFYSVLVIFSSFLGGAVAFIYFYAVPLCWWRSHTIWRDGMFWFTRFVCALYLGDELKLFWEQLRSRVFCTVHR